MTRGLTKVDQGAWSAVQRLSGRWWGSAEARSAQLQCNGLLATLRGSERRCGACCRAAWPESEPGGHPLLPARGTFDQVD